MRELNLAIVPVTVNWEMEGSGASQTAPATDICLCEGGGGACAETEVAGKSISSHTQLLS